VTGNGIHYNKGAHVRKKSALLGLVVAGVIGLTTFATGLPASAAPATSLTASTSAVNAQGPTTAAPSGVGSVVCGGPVLCIQRTTIIVNHRANVAAWANTISFTGHFELVGPQGHIANSTVEHWVAGGKAFTFKNVAEGDGYTIIAWGPGDIGHVAFRV
jgi:hypothetical protein